MSEDAHEYIIALKRYLLKELKPVQVNSNLTASNHPYDRELHMSMQTFWNLFCSGKTTQTVTCSECSNVTSRDEHFSEIMLNFLHLLKIQEKEHEKSHLQTSMCSPRSKSLSLNIE